MWRFQGAYHLKGLQRMRVAGLWLALFAILLHAATPALAQAMASGQDGLQTAIICSGDELRTIYLDADGNLVHKPAQSGLHEHCAACIHHAAPLLPTTAPLPAPRVADVPQTLPVFTAQKAISYPTGLPPRAPPA